MLLASAGCGTEPTPSLTLTGDSIILEGFGVEPAPLEVPMIATAGSITWSASSSVAWLTVAPPSGTTPDTLTLTADPAGMAGGAQTALVSITSSAGDILIPVRMQIPSLTGTWTGSLLNGNFSVQLTESSGIISGTGTMTTPGNVDPITLGGIHLDHPIIQLTFTITGFEPFTFYGSFTKQNELIGVLVGSGFAGQILGLFR